MSTRLLPATGTDPTYVVNAQSADETVPISTSVGRTITVRRHDSSSYTVTVTIPAGHTLNGTLNGTATLAAGSQMSFTVADPGVWRTVGGGAGGGSANLRNSNGTAASGKRLVVTLTPDGTEVGDLTIEGS